MESAIGAGIHPLATISERAMSAVSFEGDRGQIANPRVKDDDIRGTCFEHFLSDVSHMTVLISLKCETRHSGNTRNWFVRKNLITQKTGSGHQTHKKTAQSSPPNSHCHHHLRAPSSQHGSYSFGVFLERPAV